MMRYSITLVVDAQPEPVAEAAFPCCSVQSTTHRITSARHANALTLSHHSASPRGQAINPFLSLPGAHAVRHPFVEVSRTDHGLHATEPHSLSHLVAHAGKGEGDAPALQLLDGAQQCVAAGGVSEVY